MQKYESRVKTWNRLFKTVPGLRKDAVEEEGKVTPTPEAADMIRWKYAFRELRPRKKSEPPHPTVITTRDGRYSSLPPPPSLSA
jgi:hypothetical protein